MPDVLLIALVFTTVFGMLTKGTARINAFARNLIMLVFGRTIYKKRMLFEFSSSIMNS